MSINLQKDRWYLTELYPWTYAFKFSHIGSWKNTDGLVYHSEIYTKYNEEVSYQVELDWSSFKVKDCIEIDVEEWKAQNL